MDSNFYMANRQKLLFMVEEIHKRGFQKLRVIPSLSPSGMYWRCNFVEKVKRYEFCSSNWIYDHEKGNSSEELKYTTQELADLFIQENKEFIEHCKGEDEEYKNWYSQMLRQLKKDELPYAFADWEMPKGTWRTSEGNEIKTLPNEEEYYF
ncbi:hypothetical protein [Moheibacter stercoris]|uniref:Uncharacterized protein n=1 Tax=Moheibacter stercoris TaxID=1628251 RepID=A0ABV2LWW3_9FLAO